MVHSLKLTSTLPDRDWKVRASIVTKAEYIWHQGKQLYIVKIDFFVQSHGGLIDLHESLQGTLNLHLLEEHMPYQSSENTIAYQTLYCYGMRLVFFIVVYLVLDNHADRC